MPAFILMVVYTTEIFGDNIDSLLALKYSLPKPHLDFQTLFTWLPVLAVFPVFGKHELCPNFVMLCLAFLL